MILNTGNEVLIVSLIAPLVAQVLKLIFYYAKNHRINFRIFTGTGGMPSSHSATVSAMAVSVGLISGFDSVLFAIALISALIIMYDAAGLRRAAGKMAAQLNYLVDSMYQQRPIMVGEKLMELLGHTPLEVAMGSLLGGVFAFTYHYCLLGF